MGSGKAIGYMRVSSEDQNTARQLDGVTLDRVFEDKVTGANQDRPQLRACLDYLRDGDVLHVHSIDRLARNLLDLEKMVGSLNAKGVTVKFHKENLTFTGDAGDPFQILMRQVIGAVAQFERALIKARQLEGIRAAQKAGKHLGRKASLTPNQVAQAKIKRAAGMPVALLAKEMRVSRATMYAYLTKIDQVG